MLLKTAMGDWKCFVAFLIRKFSWEFFCFACEVPSHSEKSKSLLRMYPNWQLTLVTPKITRGEKTQHKLLFDWLYWKYKLPWLDFGTDLIYSTEEAATLNKHDDVFLVF